MEPETGIINEAISLANNSEKTEKQEKMEGGKQVYSPKSVGKKHWFL